MAYFHLNQLGSAAKYFNTSLHYALAVKNELWIGLVPRNSARIDLKKGNPKVGIEKAERKLSICLKHREFAAG